MCTYLTMTTSITGTALDRAGDFVLSETVICFDHPQEALLEHALCIDFRGGTDPSLRVAVELDALSARRLAESILATLGSDEVRALT